MSEPTASVQLIVFGQRNRDDIAGVLADTAAAGFPAIEAGNLFEAHGEEAVRRLLENTGLRVSGAHFGYGEYADGTKLSRHIAYAKSIGLKNMLCSGVADTKSIDGYRQSAAVFNAVGRRLSEEGLLFHYHNHAWEFDDLGGITGMEILSAETDPSLVRFNLDVFWLYYAGQDPAQFIRTHSDRAGYFHFKDGRKVSDAQGKPHPQFLELGRGDVNLLAAAAAAWKAGAEWIVAEQDSTTLPHRDSLEISRSYIREALSL